jgi:hypothetical protein
VEKIDYEEDPFITPKPYLDIRSVFLNQYLGYLSITTLIVIREEDI